MTDLGGTDFMGGLKKFKGAKRIFFVKIREIHYQLYYSQIF